MAFHSYKDLKVWQKACSLAVFVYRAMKDSRDYGLKDQMRRAAVSIASNIAEGSQRSPKDFRKHLKYASGSSAELQTQSYIGRQVGTITLNDHNLIIDETDQISRMISALIRSINKNNI